MGKKCRRNCIGRTDAHASGCAYIAAGKKELTVFDVAQVTGEHVVEVQRRVQSGHKKMEAWLNVVRVAEEAVTQTLDGCSNCGVEKCAGGGSECEARARRLANVRKTIPLDAALRVRTTPQIWRKLIKSHRDDLTTVYEMFKNTPARRIEA